MKHLGSSLTAAVTDCLWVGVGMGKASFELGLEG